jgi:hypothetical protein
MITNNQGLNWNVYNPLGGVNEYLTSMCRLEGIGIAGVTNFSSFIIIDTMGTIIQFYPDISAYLLTDIEVYGQDSIILLGDDAIFYSIDRGLNWENYPFGGAKNIGFDTVGGATITNAGIVFLSQDCGESWYPFNNYYETEISTHISLLESFSDQFMMYETVDFPDATYLFSRSNDTGQLLYFPETVDVRDIYCANDQTCFAVSIDSSQTHMIVYRVDVKNMTNGVNPNPLSLTLLPNPATTMLTIAGLEQYSESRITTCTLEGRFVPITFANGQANISHLPPGIYLTAVQTNKGIWREKWVKL